VQWLGAVGEVAAPVALGRVRPHPGFARTPGGPAAASLWATASNGHLGEVAVGALLGFQKLFLFFISTKLLLYFEFL